VNKLSNLDFYGNNKKCQFCLEQVGLLGINIDKNGKSIPNNYKSTIEQLKRPQTIKELQRFFGLVNFIRDYIPDLQKPLSCLTQLLKGQQKGFTRSNESDTDFDKIPIKDKFVRKNPTSRLFTKYHYILQCK
jgi:hypothetical protein